MSNSRSEVVWTPTEKYLDCRLNQFMASEGIGSWKELVKRSSQDTRWFWGAITEYFGVRWFKKYDRLSDESLGFPWTDWFVGGKINIFDNCLDYHVEANDSPAFPNRPRSGPNHAAIIWESQSGEERTLSYAELHKMSSAVAAWLVENGVGKGDAVGLYMPMVPEVVAILFGCFKVGAVAVPVFSGSGANALSARISNAEAKVVFTADSIKRGGKVLELKSVVDESAASCPLLQRVVMLPRHGASGTWHDERDVLWADVIDKPRPDIETAQLDADAPSLYLYTSGTTGKPKGTVQTHAGALLSSAKRVGFNFDMQASDRFFWFADIAWIAGLMQVLGATFWGGTIVIYDGAPSYPVPDRIWQMIDKHNVSIFCMNPTRVRLLRSLGNEWADKHAMNSLRLLGSTGSAWDKDSYLWFLNHIGKGRCPIINVAGGTELFGGMVECLPIMPLKACTLGAPCLGMDADVVDDQGVSIITGSGHLVCRKPAPSMTRGFLKDPDRYIETYFSKFPNVWYHGDWTHIDEDGYWFILGRSDDTLDVAGTKINAGEIESAILRHPQVVEAATIGIPNERTGQALICFAVLTQDAEPSSQLLSDLSDLVVEECGESMRPQDVHFVQALPKTYTAKIMRDSIRRKYLGEPVGDLSSLENQDALDAIPTMDKPKSRTAQVR